MNNIKIELTQEQLDRICSLLVMSLEEVMDFTRSPREPAVAVQEWRGLRATFIDDCARRRFEVAANCSLEEAECCRSAEEAKQLMPELDADAVLLEKLYRSRSRPRRRTKWPKR